MVADVIPCYIMSEVTGTVVNFNVEVPESINDSYNTNFSNQVTKGRSNPFKAYQSSGPRSVSFTVTMALDYRRDLVKTVDALREMLKPVDAGYILAPRVKVRIGTMLNISAVPTSFDVTWREGYKESTYRVCDCSFAFDQVEDRGTFAAVGARVYQVANSISFKDGKMLSGKKYDTGEGTKYTGIAGSTKDDLKVGVSVNINRGFFTYNTREDAQNGDNYTGTIDSGVYDIINKYKDCICLKVKNKAVWIKPF